MKHEVRTWSVKNQRLLNCWQETLIKMTSLSMQYGTFGRKSGIKNRKGFRYVSVLKSGLLLIWGYGCKLSDLLIFVPDQVPPITFATDVTTKKCITPKRNVPSIVNGLPSETKLLLVKMHLLKSIHFFERRKSGPWQVYTTLCLSCVMQTRHDRWEKVFLCNWILKESLKCVCMGGSTYDNATELLT